MIKLKPPFDIEDADRALLLENSKTCSAICILFAEGYPMGSYKVSCWTEAETLATWQVAGWIKQLLKQWPTAKYFLENHQDSAQETPSDSEDKSASPYSPPGGCT